MTDSNAESSEVVKKQAAVTEKKKTKRQNEAATSEDLATGTIALSKLKKSDVITKFAKKSGDTGSAEVQIALLTQRLETLTKHSSSNPKDHHSRRGMMHVISKRKGLLQYLRAENVARYREVISTLGLRK